MPISAPYSTPHPTDLAAMLADGPEHTAAWRLLFGPQREHLGQLLAQPGAVPDDTLTALEAAWLLEVRRLPHESERLLNRRAFGHAPLRALLAAGAAQMYDDAPAAVHWAGLALAHFTDPLDTLHLRAQCTLGLALLECGEPRRALAPLTTALRGADRDGLVHLQLDALRSLARVHAELGDPAAADAVLAHGLHLAEAHGLHASPATASLQRLQAQRSLAQHVCEDAPVPPMPTGDGFADRLALARAHWVNGGVDAARALTEALAHENARSFVPLKWQVELGALRGALDALADTPSATPVLAGRADAPDDLYALQARVLDAGHARLAGRPWSEDALEGLATLLSTRGLGRLAACLRLVRASDLASLQRWWTDPARDALDALWLAPALLHAWPALIDAASRPADRLALTRTWTRLRALASRDAPASEPPPLDLTPREWAVLQLIGERWSNAEIADRLHVSEATVKTHINRLYGKLGVRHRDEAIARVRGLVR